MSSEQTKLKLCILFGGKSTEYPVSLMSTVSILEQLDPKKYDLFLVGITKEGQWLYFNGDLEQIRDDTWWQHTHIRASLLPNSKMELALLKDYTYEIVPIDAVFPVLHGLNGEDGTVQGLLDLCGAPYVGCGVASSANCMDKVIASTLFNHYNLPHCRWDWTTAEAFLADVSGTLARLESFAPYPFFVKPSRSGSSIGVRKVQNRAEMEEAIRYAAQFDNKIVVEEAIVGKEIETAVLGGYHCDVSCCGEITLGNEFYDYNDKYVDGKSVPVIPADLPENLSEQIRSLAKRAYRALDCSGLARVDFFIRESDQQPLINEINTLPGFTAISMYPKLRIAGGVTYPQLIDQLIEDALERFRQKGN